MADKNLFLFKACCANDVEGVEKALKKSIFSRGADVDCVVYEGNPERNYPLHIAARNGNVRIVSLLIEAGAQVNVYNEKKETPLQLAAESGNVKVGQILISHGADVNEHRDTTSEPMLIAIENENVDFAKLLLQNGVDIQSSRRAYLNYAAKYNKPESIKWLARGYNINEEDHSHKTVLFEAVENGSLEAARMLIDLGANVNAMDASKREPLYFAVNNGNTEMARLLIEKGAKINNVSEGGETAKRIAVKQGNLEMIELLFSTDNFNINRNLWYASGDIKIIKLLIKLGADINSFYSDYEKYTLLEKAIGNKNLELVKTLVPLGAKLTYEAGGKMKHLFTEAVKLGDVTVVDTMLANGADINENDSAPLSEAIQLNSKPMIDYLIRKGAQPNDKTRALYDKLVAKEKLRQEIQTVPAADLYTILLSNNMEEYKLAALNRYIDTFPEQFDLDKCKGGKDIISAIINLRIVAAEEKRRIKLSDLMNSYGKAKEAELIKTRSDEHRVILAFSRRDGDYETTITRVGNDEFLSEEVMTDWN
jgi:ankyrin repeat protein